MKTMLPRLIVAASLAIVARPSGADTILSDDFTVSSQANDPNFGITTGRQTGTRAVALYTAWSGAVQVGNTSIDVGQPGGAGNGNILLLTNSASAYCDLNICSAATGPLTNEFDLYMTGASNPNADSTTWGAVTLNDSTHNGDPCWPIVGSGQFGFIARVNGGIHMWDSTGDGITPSGWDTAGFATNAHWKLIFADATGTGSPFAGNGSQVTFINGTNVLGTIALAQLNSAGLRLGFRSLDNRYLGIDNLLISGATAAFTPAGPNLSFEYDTTLSGTPCAFVPTSWTAFNQAHAGDFGTGHGGSEYNVNNPLAAPADGVNYCYINKFNGAGVGGIYQDMGPLQPNTVYTLTVAIGSRGDRINSPGIISLVNGTDNTGTVLATGGGLPVTQNTWQDYTASFATGTAVSGDLTVVLLVNGAGTIQANFDNVRLTTQTSSVPFPIQITNTTPAGTTVAVGSNAVFSVAYSTNPPVSLQWQQVTASATNDINTGVANVTNNGVVISTLTLNNVQLTDAGAYRVKAANATNLVTFIYSSPAMLTVIPTITWYAAGTYNYGFSDSSVLALAGPAGNEVYGVNFGVGPASVNGYAFDDYLNSGNMTLNGAFYTNPNYLGAYSTGDFQLDDMLNYGVWGDSGNTATLNNLTVGQTYTVLVLLDDDRSPPDATSFQITDGLTTSPSQQHAFPNGTPSVGGYIMGTFTAKATTQPLTVVRNDGRVQFNVVLVTTGIAPAPTNPPVLVDDIAPPVYRVATGGAVTLSASAIGSLPLHYQWSDQNGPINGATSSNYVFNAVTGTNFYHVTVTNDYGSVISSTATVISAPDIVTVNNFSFEGGTTSANVVYAPGYLPVGWSQFAGVTIDWMDAPTDVFSSIPDGTHHFAINEDNGKPTGGVYQDVGPLQPNTLYTLTVAIGNRPDAPPNGQSSWSPGIISLINGADNAGTVLATGGGVPATPDSWQDYTVSFTTGASVSGDLVVALSVAGAPAIQADFDNVRLTKSSVAPPVAPTFAAPHVSGGNLILTGSGGTAGGGYSLLTTTNLAAPIIWTTNTTGTLDGAGAFSNSVPIGTEKARFYRVRVP